MSATVQNTGRGSKKQLDSDLKRYSATATATLASQGKKHGMDKSLLAFGAATSAALLGGTAVEAAIVHTVVNTTIGPGQAASTANINMGGGTDFKLRAYGFSTEGLGYGFASIQGYNGGQVDGTATTYGYRIQARKFSSGELIAAGSELRSANTQALLNYGFAYSTAFEVNAGFTSSTGFLGVQTGAGNFGWIQVHVNAAFDAGDATGDLESITIIDYAYDDTGNKIAAGQVPEPGTALLAGLGMMAMGAAGVRTHRRRKKEAAARSQGTVEAS